MASTPPDIGQPTREARTGREDAGQRGNKWWTLVAVCLGTFMLLLDITIVNVALPDIQRALHSSFADLQWVVDAYALTLASFLLTAGSLADMYGRRVLYLIGLVVFTGASALCGFATSTLMLQLSRGLQGVGGAIMFAVSLALLANAFRGKDRGVAFGVWGAVTGLAVAIGPLIGGVLTSGLSWRWIFFVNVPIGIAAVALTTMRVAESRSPRAAGPDWAGFVIFTAALASLVYGLIESNQRSFTDGLVLGCLAAAGVLLAVFVIVERRSAHPMFDLTLLRLPTFSGGSVAAFGLSASIFSMLLYLVLYLQDILGYSPLGTGVRVMYLSGAILVSATVAGRLSSRVPVRLLIGPGLIIVGVGLLLMRGLNAGSAVLVHHDDRAAAMRKSRPALYPLWKPPVLHLVGHFLRNGVARTMPVAEASGFADEEVLDVPGRPRVIHTPGHTAGNAALSLADREVLIVGDTLATLSLSHGESGPQLLPRFMNEDHDRALASLEKIEPVKACWVLPGHGLPWEGSPQQAVKLARQIAARTS